jgi:uncharacterized protein YjcR
MIVRKRQIFKNMIFRIRQIFKNMTIRKRQTLKNINVREIIKKICKRIFKWNSEID